MLQALVDYNSQTSAKSQYVVVELLHSINASSLQEMQHAELVTFAEGIQSHAGPYFY